MIGAIHIMGIVNLTPDSFYAQSRAGADVLPRIAAMLAEGADVIDLGACSTRPGSPQPSLEEEWARLEPALKAITESRLSGNSVPLRFTPAISVDTYRAEIVRRTYDIIGPFMVNDISAGQLDPEMLATVGRLGLPYVAMHMRGTPENMQQFTQYSPDVVTEVIRYFGEFDKMAQDNGIENWILDPGFGFSKTLAQNYQLLWRMEELQALGKEILVGVSRKSMIYKVLGITPEEALEATQTVQYAALARGATWLRVHDVAPAVKTALRFIQEKC